MPKIVKVRSAFVAVACSIALAMSAQADALKQAIDIPAGELAAALKLLAKQSGADLVYRPEQVQGLQTGGVKGELSIEEAVTKLLEGTALRLSTDATGAMLIAAPLPADGRAANRISAVDEIVVTGSRLRGVTAPAPVTVFDRARIEELGASSVPDLLKYLPQQPYTRGEEYRFGGAQFVELRGLGADTTLVLINGRRAAVTAANAAFNAFDLNTIPVSAIERVEVLSDAASAVYGADAVGGVVNIILKHDVERPVAAVRFGTAEGGARERRASLTGGVASSRFSGVLALDYFEREFLLGTARERWRDQDYRRIGGTDQRSPSSNPGNVASRTSANLPGLPSSSAAVPAGSPGSGLTPADFLATSGERNLESRTRYQSIVPQTERASALATLEFEVTPSVTLFTEALYTDHRSTAQSSPSALSGALVPATNPFNPFGVDVTANFLLTALGPQHSVVEAESLRAVGGARGTWASWDWEVSYLDGREDARSWTANAALPARINAALAATDSAQALNPFQDGPGGSPALLASLIGAPEVSHYESTAGQWSAFARGAVMPLPAGALDVVIGGEYRREEILFDSVVFVEHDRNVSAGFAEARVPLVSRDMNVPGVDLLSLTVAARQDRYSDFGSSLNPQYSLAWVPTSNLVVRASFGTSFRPPSLFELHSPRRTVPGSTVIDPRRNGESTIITVISGGNPALDPINADSWSAGFSWSPASVGGLELSANYWRIRLDDRVRIFSQQLVLVNETMFPERIVRAAPTPAEVAADLPGALVSVDSSRINFGELETAGVDVDLRWALATRWGDFLPSLTATWIDRYVAGQAPRTPSLDRVGVASIDGTIAEWRAVAGLSWQRGVWGLSMTARYVPSYDDATFTDARTGRSIDDQLLVDAQVSVDFRRGATDSWLTGVALQAGVSNLFDDAPPFAEIGSPFGYDPSQGDLRQRFGYLNLSKRF